jgi:alpha-galactosidase
LPDRDAYPVRDLWSHETTHTAGAVSAWVPAHGTAIFRVGTGAWDRFPPSVAVGVDFATQIPGIPGAVAPPGRTVEVSLRATNNGREPVLDARLALAAPAGWAAEAVRGGQAKVLDTGQSVTAVWRLTAPAGASAGQYPMSAVFSHANGYHGRSSTTETVQVRVPVPAPTGPAELSDVPWVVAANGYGPVEKDMSNGGPKQGDGFPMVINGVKYPRGIGTHAIASVVFFIDRHCTALTVDVGIDDDRNDANKVGAATFEIWADGRKVADSGLRTWADPAVTLTADLTGATYLRLALTDGGNGNSYDRGDWAVPKLTC